MKRVGLNDPVVRETLRGARQMEHPHGRNPEDALRLRPAKPSKHPDEKPLSPDFDKHDRLLIDLTGTLAMMYDALWVSDVVKHPTVSLNGYSISEEVREQELNGTLPPFVPGPVGAYEFDPGPPQVTDAELKIIHNRWREQDQKALRELRAKNDATLASLEAAL